MNGTTYSAKQKFPFNYIVGNMLDISIHLSYKGALTHWGRVTHICVSKHTIIGSNNGLSPGRRQDIIWTNAGILLIGTLGTKFSEILIENRIFSFKKIGLNVSSAKWRPFCLGLNVLMESYRNPLQAMTNEDQDMDKYSAYSAVLL